MKLHEFWDLRIIGSYIKGELLTSPTESLVSPLTNQDWKTVHRASKGDAKHAIESAKHAQCIWKETPAVEKGRILRHIGEMMLEHRVALAEIMTYEMGKTRRDGLGEVAYAAGFFSWFAGEAERIFEKRIDVGPKTLLYLKEPVGVCGFITPWNFPLAMPARKIAAALAAGCSVVFKPSPECPVSALFLAVACSEAGVPPGVVNVVNGPAEEIGKEFLESHVVRKISFTGSTAVGHYLYRYSAGTLKKLSLELGGHAPFIVFDDADLEHAADQLVRSKFRNSGQSCVAPNRVFVQKKVAEPFLEKLLPKIKALKVGNPLEAATDLTNVLHPTVREKGERHVKDAMTKGAKAALFAQNVYEPVVLTGIDDSMQVMQEETFGPILPISSFDSDYDAYQKANNSPYGLASYLFTKSYERAMEGMKRLDYGIVGVNDGLPSAPELSFGGRKASGFGVEGGPDGIQEYLVSKCASFYK